MFYTSAGTWQPGEQGIDLNPETGASEGLRTGSEDWLHHLLGKARSSGSSRGGFLAAWIQGMLDGQKRGENATMYQAPNSSPSGWTGMFTPAGTNEGQLYGQAVMGRINAEADLARIQGRPSPYDPWAQGDAAAQKQRAAELWGQRQADTQGITNPWDSPNRAGLSGSGTIDPMQQRYRDRAINRYWDANEDKIRQNMPSMQPGFDPYAHLIKR